MAAGKLHPITEAEAVRRILDWSNAGCTLMRVEGKWRLTPPAGYQHPRGPAPRPITDAAAQQAIKAGARVDSSNDLFGQVTQ